MGSHTDQSILDDIERARANRFEVPVQIKYSAGAVRGEGVLCNISSTGALIDEATLNLTLGTELTLELCFFGDSAPVEISAKVVRKVASGFALHFVKLDERLKKLLKVVLRKASKVAKRAEEEGDQD